MITLNNEEEPGDLADLIEYAYGSAGTAWGAQRIQDGRAEPYPPFVVEIGNEQALDDTFAREVVMSISAMLVRAQGLYGRNLSAVAPAALESLGLACADRASARSFWARA